MHDDDYMLGRRYERIGGVLIGEAQMVVPRVR